MKFKFDYGKLITQRPPLIYLPLISSLFSNLIYGFIGGEENTFSYVVTILMILYSLVYFGKIKIDTIFLMLFLIITIAFLSKIFILDYDNKNTSTGILHGFQICVKLLMLAIIYPEVKKLSIFEIELIYKDFIKILIFIITLSLPIFIMANNELIQIRPRFIAMDDGDSYRYGGFGFEALDFAYCAMVGLLIILADKKNGITKKIILFFIVLTGLYLTESNFIGISLICISLYFLSHWAMNGSWPKKLAYLSFILLIISIFLTTDTKIFRLLFVRFSELEEGTSLGERILPGLNLISHYFNNFGYLKLPAPGISIAEAINISENYISFNAWGLSKVLADFGFLGIPAVIFLLFIGLRFLRNAYGNLILNSVGVASLVYVFAQAGYMNYTAIMLLMLSYQYNRIYKL